MYVVHDLSRTGGFGHSGRSAFVLDHVGAALPGDDALGDAEAEAVFPDLRFGELGLDRLLNLPIANVGADSSRARRGSRRRKSTGCKKAAQQEKGNQ